MALLSRVISEFKDFQEPKHPLKYPMIYLINQYLPKVDSSFPIKWEVNDNEGLILKDIEGYPRKRLQHWKKGRHLEEAGKEAFEKLSFETIESPEGLKPKQIYHNSCYKNNGYGADDIARFLDHLEVLIEYKVRREYLKPSDIKKHVLPRYYDIDQGRPTLRVLVHWGLISLEARELLMIHNITLILIPFDLTFQEKLSPTGDLDPQINKMLVGYLYKAFKGLMTMFTTAEQDDVEDCDVDFVKLAKGCIAYCDVDNEECSKVFSDGFSSSSSNFSHNVEPLHRRWETEMREYRLLIGYDSPIIIRQRNIWREYQIIYHRRARILISWDADVQRGPIQIFADVL